MAGLIAGPLSLRSGLLWASFLPASLGLTWQLLHATEAATQILIAAMLLLSLEQARMAVVDLQHIATVKAQASDPRLTAFQRIVSITITWELIGFYLAIPALGWGAITILASQLFFNSFAQIDLHPEQPDPVHPCGWPQRRAVLIADTLGLGLTTLWLLHIKPGIAALALLGMIVAYLSVKYGSKGEGVRG